MKPGGIVRIGIGAFPESQAACLGVQVAAIVSAVNELLPGLRWYGADVAAVGGHFPMSHATSPVLVGGGDELVARAQRVDQFEHAVFAGVPASIGSPRFRDGGLWTEEEPAADLGDALVEIRAFDTTYVEVAAADATLTQALAVRFGVLERAVSTP